MTTSSPARHTTTECRHRHRCVQGFCTVCGSTWPCWRAQTDDPQIVAARMTAHSLGLPRC